MEDEEGYTALNLRPKRGGLGGPSPARNQDSDFNPLLPPTGSMSWQQGQSRGWDPRDWPGDGRVWPCSYITGWNNAMDRGSRQCPGWLQITLGAGNLILAVAVRLLAVCVSHLVSEKGPTPAAPDCEGAGSRDPSTAECSARLEHVRSQLCPPALPGPAGGSGCKLCPTDWQLRGDKCYWVSRRSKMWSESRTNCSARGSQLLVIRDPEELVPSVRPG